jgi:hypothetical protein
MAFHKCLVITKYMETVKTIKPAIRAKLEIGVMVFTKNNVINRRILNNNG